MLTELAALCRPAATDDRAASAHALPPLSALFDAAEQHDVSGLVTAVLLSDWADRLPEDVQEGLAIHREGTRLEALRAESQLAELLDLLAARGLPVMPFKGPLLARSAYPDATLRVSLDLDLLVHPDDIAHVLACLKEAGFEHGLRADELAVVRRYTGQHILRRPGALPVEPHWHPAPKTLAFNIDVEALWRRARAATFLGAPCYLPAPEDHLFLLALHGAKEQWHKLKWLVDLAAFLTAHGDLDLAGLRAAAVFQGCRRIVDLALLLSHRVLAVPAAAPPADAATQGLAARVLRRLDRTAERPTDLYALTPYYWQLRERLSDRLRYAACTVFTPRLAHYRRLPMPPALHWLYVPLKPPWDYVLTPAVRTVRRFNHSLGRGRKSGAAIATSGDVGHEPR